MRSWMAFVCAALAVSVHARDLGFRYQSGKCVNTNGNEGLNPSYFGQCADLRNVIISKLDFSGVDFSGSKFNSSDLQSSNFQGATLVDVDFTGAMLMGALFMDTELRLADFTSANLINAKFSGAKFKQVKFISAGLAGQDFSFDSFDQCHFDGADLSGVKFEDASIVSSTLTGVNLGGADLARAKLNRSQLDKSNLRGADFHGAVLDDAKLDGSNLRDANFQGASFKGASLIGAVYNRRTRLPFSGDEAMDKQMKFMPLTEFAGIGHDISLAGLDDWNVCSVSLFKDTVPLQTILDDCKSRLVMLACRQKGSDTLKAAAYGTYAQVFKEIGSSNAGTIENGAKFYYSNNYSIGFVAADSQPQRNSCDTGTEQSESRLCFHTNTGNLIGGYRCGQAIRLNDSSEYERVFLKAD